MTNNYTSEHIYVTRGFQNPLFVISEQFILFIHLFIFIITLQVIETVWNIYLWSKRFIYFFSYLFVFILVPRLSEKEQLLFSFGKMAEPEIIGGGTDTDHHDTKLVRVGLTCFVFTHCSVFIRMFIRHQRSENSPLTTQKSPEISLITCDYFFI